MITKKNCYFVIFVALFLTSKTVAQTHINSWFRTTLNTTIAQKFKTDIEFQHRRQNSFENNNLFDKNLIYSFRTWFYYQQNENLVFAISPFAYFSNYKIIQKASDCDVLPINEYRLSNSVEWQKKIKEKIFIINRTELEYRIFKGNIENTIRLRNRLALKYAISKKLNTSFGDEIFINFVGTNAQHYFDHNRIFANFSIVPNAKLKYDFGYIFISRLPKNNINLLEESNFYLNFTYSINNTRI